MHVDWGRVIADGAVRSVNGEHEKNGVGVRTSKKKLKANKQVAKAWLRKQLTKPIARTMEMLVVVVRGHCNYYGVSGSF